MSTLVGVNRLLHSCRTVTYTNFNVRVLSRPRSYAVRRSCRGTVRYWYSTIKVPLCCGGGMLAVRSRYTCGTVKVCSWCASGMLTGVVPVRCMEAKVLEVFHYHM